MMGIDGADGIVKLDDTIDIKILDTSSLGKFAT
jgi:transcription elongation factor SPT5